MLGGVKEGITEAKEELKEEAAEREQQNNDALVALDNIPYDEKFGNALGAPFRVVVFGDWFTFFKSNDNDDTSAPLHLYTFGEYPAKEKHQKELVKLMDRDFDIQDTESCKTMLASYFNTAGIDASATILEGVRGTSVDKAMWNVAKPGVTALISAVISHIITASVDVVYLSKTDGLTLLKRLNAFAKQHYNDWNTYADAFMTGDESVGLNNAAGRGVLKKYIWYLTTKKDSPWNRIAWNA